MITLEIDLAKVGTIVLLVYAMGMACFLGYIIGKGRGFSEGMDSMKRIYGK